MPETTKLFWLSLTILGAGLVLVFASNQHRWGVFLSGVGLILLGIDARDAISILLVACIGKSPLALAGTGFLSGLLTAAIGYFLLRTPPQKTDEATTAVERRWLSLNKAQIADLKNRIAAMPVEQKDDRQISIAREGFPDCANLADDIAEAFKNAGWEVEDPFKMYAPIPDGIWIVGPSSDDPQKALLLTALSQSLGTNYEPIRLDGGSSWLSELKAIRICIGRKPR